MARPRELNFSTDTNNGIYDRGKRVFIREPSSEAVDVDDDVRRDTDNKDVIIMVRDKKNLSLALRKLQCCSQCFSTKDRRSCQHCQDPGVQKDSTVSIISNGSLRKCKNCKVGNAFNFIYFIIICSTSKV